MTELPEGLHAARRRRRDLRALAGRGRLRARRRRLARRSGPAAVHAHPAAAQRHRRAAPRPRPTLRASRTLMVRHARMRGPPDAVPARASTTPASPPSSSSTGSSPRKARAAESLGRERYLERMWRVHRRDARRSCSASSGGSARRLDWSRLRFTMDEGSARGGPRGASSGSIDDGLAYRDRGARQLVPGLPDERVRPRGHPDRGDRARCGTVRYHLVDEATGQPDPDATDHRRHDPTGDDPRRHRRRRPSRRRALSRRSSGGRSASRSSSATCRSSPTRSSSAPSAPARSRSRRPTTTTTTRPGGATACR